MKSMGQKIILVFMMLLTWNGHLYPLDIRIGLFHDHLVKAMLFTPGEGEYRAGTEQGFLGTIPAGESWYVLCQQDSLLIRDHKGYWHHSKQLRFTAPDEFAWFRAKPVLPLVDSREYMTSLLVKVSMNSLLMINEIDLEKYIMGVTETEAGTGRQLEYYKVQAILSRTFAFKNLARHRSEGFNLCDAVHCQAYEGMNRWSEDVEIGTDVTNGLVLVDRDSVLLNAAYHANSGGETRGAEQVWLNGKNYLKPVLDPFSLNQPGARWKRSMPVDEWIRYLRTKGVLIGALKDTSILGMTLGHRENYYRCGRDSLLFSVIREDLGLKSDFFDVKVVGDQVLLDGRGYGHGVGLSQEGAMEMARRGYRYTAILPYYYDQIQIVPYRSLVEAGKLNLDPINWP
jgi:stage II sporulation protein D